MACGVGAGKRTGLDTGRAAVRAGIFSKISGLDGKKPHHALVKAGRKRVAGRASEAFVAVKPHQES
jgi:hypothetical protein